MNELEILRSECSRLFKCDTIDESLELIDVYSEFLFHAIKNHHNEPVFTKADADAKLILQMIFTKTLHLKNIVGGIAYIAKDGTKLNKIIDPTILATHIRSIYETVGMFNLIYRNTKTKDEKTILYCLWAHSGLKYRQRFETVITTKENQEKFEFEKQQIEQFINIIEHTDLYKNLNEKNQSKIKSRLKKKEYLILFESGEVEILNWQQLTNVIGVRNGLMDSIYTFFSLYAHPSNVAVFQFAEMFNKGDETFMNQSNFRLKYFFQLTSVFIADYINLFPSVLKTFEGLILRDQISINFHNMFLRGKDFAINDSWKNLN